MSIRSLCWLAAAGLAVVCSGCRWGHVSIGHDDHHSDRHRVARVTRISAGHVCTFDCYDHYWDGGRIVVLTGHRHGRDCGHYWSGSHWVTNVRHIDRRIRKRIYKAPHTKTIKIKRTRHDH